MNMILHSCTTPTAEMSRKRYYLRQGWVQCQIRLLGALGRNFSRVPIFSIKTDVA